MITMYMDAPVLMTNMFNNCDLNYFFMKAGKVLCSLSGFLDLLTNFFFRFFDDQDVELYKGLSNAVDNGDFNAAGLYFGRFWKIFFVTEIPVRTESYESGRIESVIND